MTVDTSILNKERQYKREYSEFAQKIGKYQAEVGIHKYSYRDFKLDINIFVLKIDDNNE